MEAKTPKGHCFLMQFQSMTHPSVHESRSPPMNPIIYKSASNKYYKKSTQTVSQLKNASNEIKNKGKNTCSHKISSLFSHNSMQLDCLPWGRRGKLYARHFIRSR